VATGGLAAYCCQRKALHLALHETPPCHVERLDKVELQERKPAELQRRMLRHGVSRWHPDPMAAIAAAKRAAKAPPSAAWWPSARRRGAASHSGAHALAEDEIVPVKRAGI
jgi:hypothetical protein